MTTDERLDQLGKLMREGFAQTNQRLDRVDQRFDRLDAYIGEFRTEVIARFDAMSARLDMTQAAIQSFDARVPALTKAVMDLQAHLGRLEKWPAA